ncbi:hypothetical protein OS493_034386, partial [Desmophyllum pertusum]
FAVVAKLTTIAENGSDKSDDKKKPKKTETKATIMQSLRTKLNNLFQEDVNFTDSSSAVKALATMVDESGRLFIVTRRGCPLNRVLYISNREVNKILCLVTPSCERRCGKMDFSTKDSKQLEPDGVHSVQTPLDEILRAIDPLQEQPMNTTWSTQVQ